MYQIISIGEHYRQITRNYSYFEDSLIRAPYLALVKRFKSPILRTIMYPVTMNFMLILFIDQIFSHQFSHESNQLPLFIFTIGYHQVHLVSNKNKYYLLIPL